MISQNVISRVRQFNRELPLSQAKTLPNYWYLDEDFYKTEKELFLRTWQMVGWKHQLEKPGDYITFNLVDEPILVVRDETGTLNAFYNVCRHRASTILEGCGNTTKLRCPYHGWTYDLQGKLRGTPEFDGVEDFCKEKNSLHRLQVGEFGSFIFVADDCKYSLRELFEPLGSIPDYKFYTRRIYDLNCNWKVFVDNYLDGGYHVNYVHPALAGVIDYKNYRTELYKWSNVQIAPLKQDELGVNDVRSGEAAFYYWFFPNWMINLCEHTFDSNLVLPTGKDTCRVYIDLFFDESSMEWCNKSVQVCDEVQYEDVDICHRVQMGLRSRSYSVGRFSIKREAGVYQFHQLWAKEMEASLGCNGSIIAPESNSPCPL